MKDKKRIFVASFIIILILIFSAIYIADSSAIDNIDVKVKNIAIEEISLSYSKLKIYVDFENPTSQDISDVSAVFDIFIAESYVGDGSFSDVDIPKHSTTLKDVSITIYYSSVAAAVITGLQTGNFDLIFQGIASGKIFFNLIPFSTKFSAAYSYS